MIRPDPFTPVLIAASADYVPDPNPAPIYAHQWEELLEQCRTALERRRTSYPAMIKRGTITEADAKADIAGWEALVAEWQWVVSDTNIGAPPSLQTLVARVAAVELAMVRVDQELARGNRSYDILRQSHLIEALRWHLAMQRHCDFGLHQCARNNHKFREAQGKRWCGTCERWATDPAIRACTSTGCGLPREMAA